MSPALLQRLIELARQRRDAAQLEMNRIDAQAQAAAHTLQTLVRFRAEAQDKGPVRAQRTVPVALISQAMHFDQRMVHAIQRQQTECQRQTQAVANQRAVLLSAQQRTSALEQLAQRHALHERARQAKADQKITDEFATQRAARRATRSLP